MRREITNAFVNYISTIYIMVLTFICNALYFRYLGSELYALVGLALLIATIINLLDFGFSVILLREVAAKNQATGVEKLHNIIHSIELIFICLCFLIVPGVFIYLLNLPESWKAVFTEKGLSLSWLALIISLFIVIRFYSIIYRAGIIGLSELVKYNAIIVIFNSLRYLLALIYMVYISNDIVAFFLINLLFSLLEFASLRKYFLRKILLPKKLNFENIKWKYFKNLMPYCLSLGFASLFLTIFSNADRILLSNELDIKYFGYYSVLLLISSSMVNVATPILTSFNPKLISLVAENNIEAMYSMYRFMTKAITLVLAMVTVYLVTFSKDILYLITGDYLVVEWGRNIFIIHLLGSVFFVINSFLYYLQNALGKYKIHLYGTFISLLMFIPFLIYLFNLEGAAGAAKAWLYFNVAWFLTWGLFFYIRLDFKYFTKWLFIDIIPILIYCSLTIFIMEIVLLFNFTNVFFTLIAGALILTIMMFLGLMCIGPIRKKFLNIYFYPK